jgi:two-component system cell cycle response regulator
MSRILVIEDNLNSLELMSYLLAKFGHDVARASNGEEGLAALAGARFDIVACDVHMPKVDGYEVLRTIRGRPELRGMIVIAVTASAMVGDREQLLGAGFDGYLSKPIDPMTFVSQVEAFLLPNEQG